MNIYFRALSNLQCPGDLTFDLQQVFRDWHKHGISPLSWEASSAVICLGCTHTFSTWYRKCGWLIHTGVEYENLVTCQAGCTPVADTDVFAERARNKPHGKNSGIEPEIF